MTTTIEKDKIAFIKYTIDFILAEDSDIQVKLFYQHNTYVYFQKKLKSVLKNQTQFIFSRDELIDACELIRSPWNKIYTVYSDTERLRYNTHKENILPILNDSILKHDFTILDAFLKTSNHTSIINDCMTEAINNQFCLVIEYLVTHKYSTLSYYHGSLSIANNDLTMLIFLSEHGLDLTIHKEQLLKQAIIKFNKEIQYYLVDFGADPELIKDTIIINSKKIADDLVDICAYSKTKKMYEDLDKSIPSKDSTIPNKTKI